MKRFIASRLLQGALVVLAVATLTFTLLHLAPGDPLMVGDGGRPLTPEQYEQRRTHLGLDRSIPEQYFIYMSRVVRGDLGTSIHWSRPVRDLLLEKLPNTVLLAVAAWILDFGIGITAGVAQAARAGSRGDRLLAVGTVALSSTPVFWLGVILLLVFAQWLGFFPVGWSSDPLGYNSTAAQLLDLGRHLFLPALTLGLVGAAATARFQRAATLEVLGQDFIRTARAKGLREKSVVFRHALRNSLLPAVTLMGTSLPLLLSGAVFTERVFAWPGLGNLTAEAVGARDYEVVTAAAIMTATLVVIGSFVADLAYRVADPRTRVPA